MTTRSAPSPPRLGDLDLRPIVAVGRSTRIVEATRTMHRHDIDWLVVAEPGERIAVLTEREVTRAVADARGLDAAVGTIACADPLTLPADAGVLDAAMAMLRRGVRHVVVTRDARALGVVSAQEVMAALAEAVVPERLFLIATHRISGGRGGR